MVKHPLWHFTRFRRQISHSAAAKNRLISPIHDLIDNDLLTKPGMPRIENLKRGIMGV